MTTMRGISSVCLVILALSLVELGSADLRCTDPQKGFYMSYNALSKRDTMTELFMLIDSRMKTYAVNYTDPKAANYLLTSMHPQLYYNEHHQKEVYIDPQHVNVSLGDVEFAYRLDYNITRSGATKSGWARGRVLMDQTAYFIKRLLIKDGFLEWDPTEASNLTLTFPISIEYSEPTLEYDDKATIELLLNDHVGDRKLRAEILQAFNQLYKVNLKEHLNKEDIISNLNISYSYKNININFINAVKNYTLANNDVKGLEAFFFFEVENKTFNCTPDRITFNEKDYGGVQEIYSISSWREAFKYALELGLADVKLGKQWEVPSFQFYMGDLSNAVPFAEKVPADDPFEVECKWVRTSKDNVKLVAYDNHQLYAEIDEVCTFSYKAQQIIQLDVTINFIVRVLPQDDTLTFMIVGSNPFSPVYKSLHPSYIVTNESYARHAISRVLEGFAKSVTFGTGWKTAKRKFPAVHANGDYFIVFDPSQI